jgi:hypothetical protein
VLILNDFKSFEPEVLILGDFKSLFPEVLILVGLKSLRLNEMQKIEKFLEVLIVGGLAEIAIRAALILKELARRNGRLARTRFCEFTLNYSITTKSCQCIPIRHSSTIGHPPRPSALTSSRRADQDRGWGRELVALE